MAPENSVASSATELTGLEWEELESRLVTPDSDQEIHAGRYQLVFRKGALSVPTVITVSEHDPLVADVEFGPDGATFHVPVEVTIDYTGTALDPESPLYRGQPPGAFWYDPDSRTWVPIPFDADIAAKKVYFQVTHFSRYGLTDATQDGEWQWTRGGRPGHQDRSRR